MRSVEDSLDSGFEMRSDNLEAAAADKEKFGNDDGVHDLKALW